MSRNFLVLPAWYWPRLNVSRLAKIATSCSILTDRPRKMPGSCVDEGTLHLQSSTHCCCGQTDEPMQPCFPRIGTPGVLLSAITTPFRQDLHRWDKGTANTHQRSPSC